MRDNQSQWNRPETRRIGDLEFEVFRNDMPRSTEPTVTLERSKRIFVNGAAARLFGHPERVMLFYNAQKRLIAIMEAKPDEPGSLKVVQDRSGRDWERSGYAISAPLFFKQYGLPTTESRRFAAEHKDGALCFSLDQPLGITGPGGHLQRAKGRSG